MSTTTSPGFQPTDAGASASTPTSSSSQSDSDTATLYLFTFLATILILVLLSASLVLRSYIVRRRYRQRLQQALADGLFVDLDRSAFNGAGQFDPLGFRRATRRPGPKPVLWDTWIRSADKHDTWSSITPVAVHCMPPLSPSISSPPSQPSAPPGPLSALAQPRPSFVSQLHLPSPFSRSSQPSSPRQQTPLTSTRSPPPAVPTSPDPSTRDDTTLSVCVLVAMPDVSAPVHRPASDAKGKGVDPQAHQQGGDSLLAPPHRSGARIPHPAVDEEGLPLLEFGVVEVRTREWV